MGAAGQRRDLIEECAAIGDDARAARGVIALRAGVDGQDGVGAVQRVVEADPAGIGGIERIACIADRHHQLRAGHRGDLRIDVGGVDRDALGFVDQIADFAQEPRVRGDVEGLDPVLAPPGIDAGLQFVATRQQRAMARREFLGDGLEAAPELMRRDSRAGQRFLLDEGMQGGGDFQPAHGNGFTHSAFTPKVIDLPHSIQSGLAGANMATVRDVTFELLRDLGMRRIFGNPGSTELTMFKGFPADFSYVLGLQESVVVGMADGYAQATRNAALVNLHSAVHFLSLLMEERGAGSLAEVAEHVHAKLVRRHPHIFGTVEVDSAGDVLRNWDAIKKTEEGREPGIFGEVPESLPGPLYARKVQRRAASTGFDFEHVPYDAVRGELDELEAAPAIARSAFTRPATCCSPRSTWRAS